MFCSLQNMKLLCTVYQITNLGCSRLGCGLDGLQWETVRNMLWYLFRNSIVKVHVYTKDEMTEEEKLIIPEHQNSDDDNTEYYIKNSRSF